MVVSYSIYFKSSMLVKGNIVQVRAIQARDLEALPWIMAGVVCDDIVECHVIQLLGSLIKIFNCTIIQIINYVGGTKTTL